MNVQRGVGYTLNYITTNSISKFQEFKCAADCRNHIRSRTNRVLKRRKPFWQNIKHKKISLPNTTKTHPLRREFKPSHRDPLEQPNRTVPRKIEVFEAKEELNIEKQTTPIETSVTAREIFKHENDYEEYLEMLKPDLATLKAKYIEVLNSLEEELPREISDKE